VTEALVAALEPQSSDEILDLAGGTGDLAQALSGRVARVLLTDFSPVMVEAARRRSIPGAEHRVMDLQSLELPDDAFDGVVCRFGFMLVPDRERGFAETRRVLKPGGRLAFATWAPAKRNPWATAYGPVLIERGLLEPPQPGQPGQFALSDPDEIELLVRGAGFDRVETHEVPIEYRFESWEAYSRLVTNLAASLRATLQPLDAGTRASIDTAARARLEPFRADEGYVVPGLALVTSAA
jgi:ubiquinone/menaquinone biosynthesis C-methylase UbiE